MYTSVDESEEGMLARGPFHASWDWDADPNNVVRIEGDVGMNSEDTAII